MKLIIFIHFLSLRERKFICIVSLLSHSLRCLSLRAVLILAPVYFGSIYSNWMDPHTPYVILQKTSGSNRSCSGYQVLMPTLSTPMFILIPLEMVERHSFGETFLNPCSDATTCPTLCDLVNCSMLAFPGLPRLSHQCLFQWVCSLHQVAKVLELQLQHLSFQ